MNITKGQLAVWVAQLNKDADCDATDRQLDALIRQSLEAMNGKPVLSVQFKNGWPVDGTAGIISGSPSFSDGYHDFYAVAQVAPVTDIKPTAWKLEGGGAPASATLDEGTAYADPLREVTPLYEHAKSLPVVPDEMTTELAWSNMGISGEYSEPWSMGWNACRAAMLQESLEGAGATNNCRNSENVQVVQVQSGAIPATEPVRSGDAVVPVNDVTAGKPLTITLPDISSKAFWNGTGKSEVFHPETYKRWVKEAIERCCVIARIDVEVK